MHWFSTPSKWALQALKGNISKLFHFILPSFFFCLYRRVSESDALNARGKKNKKERKVGEVHS